MSKTTFKQLTRKNNKVNNYSFIESNFGRTVKSETQPKVKSEWEPNLLVRAIIPQNTKEEKQLLKSIKSDIKLLSPNQKKLNRDQIIEQIITSQTPRFGSFHLNLA